MSAAADIDPTYAQAFTEALDAGVEAMAWRAQIDPAHGIALLEPVPVILP